MTSISYTYNLAAAGTYETPEKAIHGILSETEEIAKEFSPDTKKEVIRSAKAVAEIAKELITTIAAELNYKIQQFPETKEQAMRNAAKESWDTASAMRKLCLNNLEYAA